MTQGNCPKCNSTDLAYEKVVDGTPSVYYPFECNNCGFVGREHHNLTFTEFTDENDTPITEEEKDYCDKGKGCKHNGENTCANAAPNGCYEERD